MGCEADSFEDDLADLSSAEDFLDYFGIDYEAPVVQVTRLHILQRSHDYLAKQEAGNAPEYQAWRKWLELAYRDFVDSSAQQEKVLAVYRKADGSSFLPLSALTG